MDDLLCEFLTETNENISVLDVELVALEANPNNPGLLGNIFRLMHTIKGTCGFLGLPRLEKVAHAAENVLGKFREGTLAVTDSTISPVLAALDVIKMIIASLESTESEPDGDDQALIDSLNAIADGTAIEKSDKIEEVVVAVDIAAAEENDFEFTPVAADYNTDANVQHFENTTPVAVVATAPAEKKSEDKVAHSKQAASAPANSDHAASSESNLANQSIRVNVKLLEKLMTTVSELVLTRNQLLQTLRSQKDSEFTVPLQRLNHVVSELQEDVMKTRMQPIGNAWSKLPRIIRDLGLELGKKIELDMRGAETELDRQVMELIKDPLTHMVRNSADHGIERPAERLAAGKPETGRIRLNAFHEGGHIIIEIADDGRGLSIDKIRKKCIENGLATEAELDSMSESQIHQYIFKAGFSTAETVTSVSGRGVGMDVVRSNIEKIGGTAEMKSQHGKGTTFTIKIPLTLAIVSALILESGGERFAIPQISVLELVRATRDGEYQIERIKGTPVLRLRNRLLPLVSLNTVLKIEKDAQANPDESYIVVTQVGAYSFGIIVDRVFDTEEIVVKPVSPILRNIPMFSGNTILGDGSVIMILDPNGIASATGELNTGSQNDAQEHALQQRNLSQKTSLLLFRVGTEAPKAVPLSLIARLEDFACSSIEISDNRPVVQYRDSLMPLVSFDGYYQPRHEGQQPVLVFSDSNRSMGLIVDEIIDIVEQEVDIQLSGSRPGLFGSAIIAGKATDVIDVGHYLNLAFADWFNTHSQQEAFEHEKAEKRVLLVDDSPFFRNLLTPLLSIAGYDVTTVDSAKAALDLCEAGEIYDAIISDIEMPGMNGFDFARTVRNGSKWQTTPMVALTSHATNRDLERGRAAGFSDYIAKLDRDGLLNSLAQTIDHYRGAA